MVHIPRRFFTQTHNILDYYGGNVTMAVREFKELWLEECTICLTEEDVAFYFINECKCNYLICVTCINKLNSCPFCRAPFISARPPHRYHSFRELLGARCCRCLSYKLLYFNNECRCPDLLCQDCIHNKTACPLCLTPFISGWYVHRPYLSGDAYWAMTDGEWTDYWGGIAGGVDL